MEPIAFDFKILWPLAVVRGLLEEGRSEDSPGKASAKPLPRVGKASKKR